jgi:nucleoside transporter
MKIQKVKLNTKINLSVMMFLQFFIWGAWYVTMGTFLAKNLTAQGSEIANAYSTQSWGAIIAPLFIGMIADKFINAERILGILHLIGAALQYGMYTSADFGAFYPFVLGYMIAYMPTLALVNSISFNQMKNPEKEFSLIRVFGTIGWIVAGLAISALAWDSESSIQDGMLKKTFLMASIASLTLGIFSFFLPKTPPAGKNSKNKSFSDLLGLDALNLLKDKNFAIFFISSILICIPLAFYYQITNTFLTDVGMSNPTGKMTIGQMSEVAFLLALPIFFTRYGFKKTIIIGMLAWALRYVFFAIGNNDNLSLLLLLGIALHGICYDFFFVSGQLYTNEKAGDGYKSSAQGLIALATYGIGMLIGFKVAGIVTDAYKGPDGLANYQMIWIIPAIIAAAVAILFAFTFKYDVKKHS